MRVSVPLTINKNVGTNKEKYLVDKKANSRTVALSLNSQAQCIEPSISNGTSGCLQDLAKRQRGKEDWDKHIDIVTYAYGTALHRMTNATPFYMNYGREARVPLDILLATNSEVEPNRCEYSDELNQRLIEAYEEAKAHADGVLRCAKEDYDRKVRSRVYKVGDHVWLKNDKDKSKFCKALARAILCENEAYRSHTQNTSTDDDEEIDRTYEQAQTLFFSKNNGERTQ
jgi:hypothetical protein